MRTAQAWDGKDLSSSPQPFFFFLSGRFEVFPCFEILGALPLALASLRPPRSAPSPGVWQRFDDAPALPRALGSIAGVQPPENGCCRRSGGKTHPNPPSPWSPCTLRDSGEGASSTGSSLVIATPRDKARADASWGCYQHALVIGDRFHHFLSCFTPGSGGGVATALGVLWVPGPGVRSRCPWGKAGAGCNRSIGAPSLS